MNTVMVRYTVRDEFADTNAANIRRVMADLRELDDPGIRYHAFRVGGGSTFVHFSMFADDDAAERLTSRETFREFQRALRESGPASPPVSETLELVGASYPL